MGVIIHHTIVVTGHDDIVGNAHAKAKEIFPRVSGIVIGTSNGTRSFFIPPDGKEGWDDSEEGDEPREQFLK